MTCILRAIATAFCNMSLLCSSGEDTNYILQSEDLFNIEIALFRVLGVIRAVYSLGEETWYLSEASEPNGDRSWPSVTIRRWSSNTQLLDLQTRTCVGLPLSTFSGDINAKDRLVCACAYMELGKCN